MRQSGGIVGVDDGRFDLTLDYGVVLVVHGRDGTADVFSGRCESGKSRV